MAALVHPDKTSLADATEAFKPLGSLNNTFGNQPASAIKKILQAISWQTDAEWEFSLAWAALKRLPAPVRSQQPPQPPSSGGSADESC